MEDAYASEFFEIYKVKYGEFLAGLDAHFTSDDIAASIMAAMKEKMADELPEAARDIISKWTKESYNLGMGRDWDDDKWKVTDRAALDFFKKHDQHFFGKQFQHYSDEMRKVVEDELEGKARAYDKKTVERMRGKLGEAFDHPYIKDYYDLVIRNTVNKSRNYGRVFTYERLGIAEVEIVPILDKKTSKICRTMNGRRISVKFLADHVREVLKTPMDELTEHFAWPKPNDADKYAGMSTEDILKDIKCPLPPFHGRCRTTTVIGKKITVKKSGGGEINGEPGKTNRFNKTRAREIQNLKREELKSKVRQQVTNPYWDRDTGDLRLNEHIERHGPEFGDYNDSYEKISKKVLKFFDNIYTFREGRRRKWALYSKSYNALLIIDENSGQILTMFRIDDIKKHIGSNKARHYLEIR